MEKDQLVEYYQKELTYIRNLAGEFADLHDDIAGKLKLNKNECNDPHTERIIEAFAFLSARIHKKIDDHFPEIIESLFDVIYPEYNRPVPSMAIVEMNPGENIKKITVSGHPIDRHTNLYSKTQENDPVCRFKTCYPVRMYPLKIETITKGKNRITGNDFISLEIVAKNPKPFLSALEIDTLRVFIAGASHNVFQLYDALFHYQDIKCEIMKKNGDTVNIPGAYSLKPVGFNDNESLIPEQYSNRSFPGYRLLYEFFLYPEKFLFFDIKGLDHIKKQPGLYDRMRIHIQLKKSLPGSVQISDDTFRLNATPIINLFEKKDIRLKLNPYQTEFLVTPDKKNSMTTEIFSIDNVLTTDPSPRKKQMEYAPYYSTDHTIYSGSSQNTVYFQVRRKKSKKIEDNGTDMYLSFHTPQDKRLIPDNDLLMLNLTCTNREAPMYLNFNPSADRDFRIDEKYAHVKCILKPTRTRRPFKNGGLQWRLLSHLSLNYMSLLDKDALQEILRLYNLDDSKSSQQFIEGIRSITYDNVSKRLNNRSFCRGIQVTVEFDESHYVGNSVVLFASVIERFLGQYVSINSFSQLIAKSIQTNETIHAWSPRSGDTNII